jgi:dienelactone hydrolase
MAHIVLFHPSIGLTRDVKDAADRLRRDGHNVLAPDLLEGRIFEEGASAQQYLDRIGIREFMMRASAAVSGFPAAAVYMGYSVGSVTALRFAAKKPGTLGCIAVSGAASLAEFGVESWPAAVPLQLHWAARDPWKRADSIASLEESVRASGAKLESFEYPCAGHLFSFASLADHEETSAREMWGHIADFLARIPCPDVSSGRAGSAYSSNTAAAP